MTAVDGSTEQQSVAVMVHNPADLAREEIDAGEPAQARRSFELEPGSATVVGPD
jgi:hypothetical protein